MEAQFEKDKGVLEATEKQHSAVLESKVLQSHRRRDLETEVEASAKINIEQEERARVRTEAVLDRKSNAETKVVEVVKNKDLLEALMIKAEADEDGGRRKVSEVNEKKKLAKERLDQVEECVDQLIIETSFSSTQLRKTSPSVGAMSRGNRSLLQPPTSPMMLNKVT